MTTATVTSPMASALRRFPATELYEWETRQCGGVVHSTATTDRGAYLGDGVIIGPFAKVDRCRFMSRVVVGAGARIMSGARLGYDSAVRDGAIVPAYAHIGDERVVRAGCVLAIADATGAEQLRVVTAVVDGPTVEVAVDDDRIMDRKLGQPATLEALAARHNDFTPDENLGPDEQTLRATLRLVRDWSLSVLQSGKATA